MTQPSTDLTPPMPPFTVVPMNPSPAEDDCRIVTRDEFFTMMHQCFGQAGQALERQSQAIQSQREEVMSMFSNAGKMIEGISASLAKVNEEATSAKIEATSAKEEATNARMEATSAREAAQLASSPWWIMLQDSFKARLFATLQHVNALVDSDEVPPSFRVSITSDELEAINQMDPLHPFPVRSNSILIATDLLAQSQSELCPTWPCSIMDVWNAFKILPGVVLCIHRNPCCFRQHPRGKRVKSYHNLWISLDAYDEIVALLKRLQIQFDGTLSHRIGCRGYYRDFKGALSPHGSDTFFSMSDELIPSPSSRVVLKRKTRRKKHSKSSERKSRLDSVDDE